MDETQLEKNLILFIIKFALVQQMFAGTTVACLICLCNVEMYNLN